MNENSDRMQIVLNEIFGELVDDIYLLSVCRDGDLVAVREYCEQAKVRLSKYLEKTHGS